MKKESIEFKRGLVAHEILMHMYEHDASYYEATEDLFSPGPHKELEELQIILQSQGLIAFRKNGFPMLTSKGIEVLEGDGYFRYVAKIEAEKVEHIKRNELELKLIKSSFRSKVIAVSAFIISLTSLIITILK